VTLIGSSLLAAVIVFVARSVRAAILSLDPAAPRRRAPQITWDGEA